MNHTITLSDETFSVLTALAQARGVTVDSLLASMAQDVLNRPVGKPMTGEEFLRLLGADDDEINAPIDDDESEA